MYVTVTFILSVMMKLVCLLGFERTLCVILAVEYSLLQLFKPAMLLPAFVCTEETI